jgi:hypothetical protein
LPLKVGVPEMMPVLAARLSPVGSCPAAMLQMYGDVPPIAVRVKVYAVLTTPCGNVVVEIAGGEGGSAPAAAMVTGTACDSCIVCVFCTCN